MMTGSEIFERLKNSSERWGGNQPSIYLVTAVLELMPLDEIRGGYDRYQFIMSRELSIPENYFLANALRPNTIHIEDGEVNVWWD